MSNSEKGQSLIEVLVVLVVASMMIIALIMIILTSLKNAQFAQNQTKATKIAQDTMDQIRILRDSNQNSTIKIEGKTEECFIKLWENISSPVPSDFYCGPLAVDYCYYKLNVMTPPSLTTLERKINNPTQKVVLTDSPEFSRQIKVNQTTSTEVKLIVEISWTDSTGEHSSNLETYLTKPNYDCI